MILRKVTDIEYVGASRYTGYVDKSIRLKLECGHEQISRKASQGVPERARCKTCEQEEANREEREREMLHQRSRDAVAGRYDFTTGRVIPRFDE